MKARFAEMPEAVREHAGSGREVQPGNRVRQAALSGFHSARSISRARATCGKLLAEGLRRRYGIRARAEGREFIVESVEDAQRLPTWIRGAAANQTRRQPSGIRRRVPRFARPAVAAAVKAIMDRLHTELKVIEKTGFRQLLPDRGRFRPLRPRARASRAWRAVRRPVRW